MAVIFTHDTYSPEIRLFREVRFSIMALARIITAFLYIAVCMYITGYASPYWLQKKEPPEARSGLWVSCVEENITMSDANDTEYVWVCLDSKEFMIDDWGESWIPGVRVLSTLGLITLLLTTTLSSITTFWEDCGYNMGLAFCSMSASIATSFFSLTVLIIQGAKTYSEELESYTLSWSFGMCCVATCLIIIATGLLYAEVELLNQEAIRQKFGVCGAASPKVRQRRQVGPDPNLVNNDSSARVTRDDMWTG